MATNLTRLSYEIVQIVVNAALQKNPDVDAVAAQVENLIWNSLSSGTVINAAQKALNLVRLKQAIEKSSYLVIRVNGQLDKFLPMQIDSTQSVVCLRDSYSRDKWHKIADIEVFGS
jgi:hypothetical protein